MYFLSNAVTQKIYTTTTKQVTNNQQQGND
jgi:hypothetical protein